MFEMTNDHLSSSLHWYRKLSVVTLFEPDDFLSESNQGSPSTLEDKCWKVKFQGSRKIVNVFVVKRKIVKSWVLKRRIWIHEKCKCLKKSKMQKNEKNRRKWNEKKSKEKIGYFRTPFEIPCDSGLLIRDLWKKKFSGNFDAILDFPALQAKVNFKVTASR